MGKLSTHNIQKPCSIYKPGNNKIWLSLRPRVTPIMEWAAWAASLFACHQLLSDTGRRVLFLALRSAAHNSSAGNCESFGSRYNGEYNVCNTPLKLKLYAYVQLARPARKKQI